jgi:hypothetical protein
VSYARNFNISFGVLAFYLSSKHRQWKVQHYAEIAKDIAVSVSSQQSINTLLKVKGGNREIGGNLTITGDLVVEDANIITEIRTNQDFIQDDDLTIAKTDGLQAALDSTAELTSANTFTGLQTIVGDLKADHVLVKITAPTLNTHLISKLYVDTALIGKQNTLTAGTGIDITSNVISSTSTYSFVGLRAVTSQAVDLNVAINAVIPFNSVSVNDFAYDTENMFDATASSYTIPTGYSDYWIFHMNLFIAEYAETFRRAHLRVTRGATSFDPLQVGNYNTQINMLSGTIPVLEGDILRMFVSNGGPIRIYGQQYNCWFKGRYIG